MFADIWNPWLHDSEEVPDDGGVRRSGRRLTILGTVVWLIVLGAVAALFATDVGGEQLRTVVLNVLGLAAIATALTVAGWLLYEMLRRLSLLSGTVVTLFRLGFLLALPLGTWLLAGQFDLLNGPLFGALREAIPLGEWTRQLAAPFTGAARDALPI